MEEISMNPFSQGPGFGQRGPRGWLLPLIIGLALGALVFGGRWSMFGGFGPDNYGRERGPRREQPAIPQAPAAPQAPATPRGEHARGSGFERDHGHGPFGFGWQRGGFGIGGLLLPLALIGAGLWLVSGRNRGSGGSGGAGGWHGPEQQADWNTPPGNPAPPQPAPHVDPTPPGPTTGPTRML